MDVFWLNFIHIKTHGCMHPCVLHYSAFSQIFAINNSWQVDGLLPLPLLSGFTIMDAQHPFNFRNAFVFSNFFVKESSSGTTRHAASLHLVPYIISAIESPWMRSIHYFRIFSPFSHFSQSNSFNAARRVPTPPAIHQFCDIIPHECAAFIHFRIFRPFRTFSQSNT